VNWSGYRTGQLLAVATSVEFSDVYSALGCEITMIEALDQLIGFDRDIAQSALITPRY